MGESHHNPHLIASVHLYRSDIYLHGEQGWRSSESARIPPIRPRGPFLERPGKLTGPVSYFEIEVSRKVGWVLTSNEVHFVSLVENFTVNFQKLWNSHLDWKTKQLNGPGNYREFRETSPWSNSQTRRHMWVEFVVGSLLCSERFSSGISVFPSPPKPTFSNSNSIPNARASSCKLLVLRG